MLTGLWPLRLPMGGDATPRVTSVVLTSPPHSPGPRASDRRIYREPFKTVPLATAPEAAGRKLIKEPQGYTLHWKA